MPIVFLSKIQHTVCMTPLVTAIIGFLSGLAGSGALKLFDHVLKRKSLVYEEVSAIKREKYRNILVQMHAILDRENPNLNIDDRQARELSESDVMCILRTNAMHLWLYASDPLIFALKDFLEDPSKETYFKTLKAMREEIRDSDTTLSRTDLDPFF
jgi:hypothetical protein